MRARGSFRVVLDTEDRFEFVTHAFDGLIVQINPIDLHFRRQALGVNCKPMILGGNFHTARLELFDRLVAATVTKFEFEGAPTESLPQDLVPEANTKNRNPALHQILYSPYSIAQCRGISWTI